MLPRLKFPKGNQRKFVCKVLEKSNLKPESLGKLVGVSPRTIRDWKRVEHHITNHAVNLLCSRFDIPQPRSKERLIKDWRLAKTKAARKGGFAHFKKYGSPGTPEGRRKGGLAAIKTLRERGLFCHPKTFTFPKNQTIELAEMVGILLGDGCITEPGRVSVTLNMTKDAEYRGFVGRLGEQLFGESPKVLLRESENASISYYYGVKLVEYLISIGLQAGNKVKNQVGVPRWVKKSSDFSTACLRGLVDTDGCITTHTYQVSGKTYSYKKLVFGNRSAPLIEFVHGHLKALGFNSKVSETLETKQVWLYNHSQTKDYLRVVGTNNSRILKQGG